MRAAARLPHLRSRGVETGRKYDRENPTCIHYDLKLKVSLRGAGKKRSSQIDLLNKSDVVLAPSDLYETGWLVLVGLPVESVTRKQDDWQAKRI